MVADMVPAYTNIWLKRINRMYVKANPMPSPRFQPMPPLFFRDDRATPIIVRMNAEKGSA